MGTVQVAHALLDIGALAGREPQDGSLEPALLRFITAAQAGCAAEGDVLEVDAEALLGALVVVLTRLAGELADALDQDVAATVERLRPLVDAQLVAH
jgi:hypothetical protein